MEILTEITENFLDDEESERAISTSEDGMLCSRINYQLRRFLDGKNFTKPVQ